jgi:hypothetical protein
VNAVFAIRVLHRQRDRSIERVTFTDAAGAVIVEKAPAPLDYDPRTRPWYEAAAGIVAPVSIGPYQMATTGKLGMRSFLVLVTPLRSALLLAQHRVVVAAPMDELTTEARRSLFHALLISAMVVISAILLALFV